MDFWWLKYGLKIKLDGLIILFMFNESQISKRLENYFIIWNFGRKFIFKPKYVMLFYMMNNYYISSALILFIHFTSRLSFCNLNLLDLIFFFKLIQLNLPMKWPVRSDKLDGLFDDLRLRPLRVSRLAGSGQAWGQPIEERVETKATVLFPDFELRTAENKRQKNI